MAGGCHLNRDMLALLTQAGFDMTCIVPYYKGLFLVIEAQTSPSMAPPSGISLRSCLAFHRDI